MKSVVLAVVFSLASSVSMARQCWGDRQTGEQICVDVAPKAQSYQQALPGKYNVELYDRHGRLLKSHIYSHYISAGFSGAWGDDAESAEKAVWQREDRDVMPISDKEARELEKSTASIYFGDGDIGGIGAFGKGFLMTDYIGTKPTEN